MSKDKKSIEWIKYFPNINPINYGTIVYDNIPVPHEMVENEEQDLPILDENVTYKLVLENGEVYGINVNDYDHFKNNFANILKNGYLYDKNSKFKYLYSENGANIIHTATIDDEEYNQFKYSFNTDFYGKYKIVSEEKKPITKASLSFEDLISIIYTPTIYFKKIKKEVSPINNLISCIFQEKGQFDEKFIIKPKSPDSPLLDKYLINLSELVNEQINNLGEVENIEELENKAYKNVGYNKPFEAVINEAKDFEEYFRFLLIKKEKQVISQKEYDYVTLLHNEIKDKFNFKNPGRNKIGKEFYYENEKYSKLFSFSELIDRYDESDSRIHISLFLCVPNILKLSEYLEKNKLDIKIGMIYEIINNNYNKKSKVIIISLFVSDYNYNCKFIDLKSTTINKYKNKFIELISEFDKTYNNNKSTLLSRELKNFNSI